MNSLLLRQARTTDATAITAIYNQGIAEKCATFETELRRVDDLLARLADQSQFLWWVATDSKDAVLGWANVSSYRPRTCYAGIAEFSIYLDRESRGRGVGRRLLPALIDAAQRHGYWKLVSRIFTFNASSRALCKACGFREVGVYEKHGQLDGQWLDVVIVERLLPDNLGAPSAPL